jgi:hypothetical protein
MNNSLPGPHDEQRVAETSYQLKACSSRLEGYISATDVLQQRIENMTKFVSVMESNLLFEFTDLRRSSQMA